MLCMLIIPHLDMVEVVDGWMKGIPDKVQLYEDELEHQPKS